MTPRASALGFAIVLGIALAVEATAVTHPIVPADRAQRLSRTIDRTMSCPVPLHAGLREIQVAATSGFRDQENRSLWKQLGNLRLSAGGFFGGVGFVVAAAGAPEPKDVTWPGQGLWVGTACRLSSARLALTTRGLTQGGVASQIEDAYECVAPRTVLVRVRATFRVPTRLRLRAGGLRSGAPVREAAFIVHTAGGKPLAYASASESGRARVLTAPSCLPD